MKYSWIPVTEASNPKTGIKTPSALDAVVGNWIDHIDHVDGLAARADLAQLRADLQVAQERIAWLTSDIGESGLAAINRLIAACERGDIAQHTAPDLSIARDEILRQARQLAEAREILSILCDTHHSIKSQYAARKKANAWLAANPAPSQDDERIDKQLDNSGWEADEVAEV